MGQTKYECIGMSCDDESFLSKFPTPNTMTINRSRWMQQIAAQNSSLIPNVEMFHLGFESMAFRYPAEVPQKVLSLNFSVSPRSLILLLPANACEAYRRSI